MLRSAKPGGMRQTATASPPAASSPQAAATNPDLRRTPMRISSRIIGSAAARADRLIECKGSRGWGQGVINGNFHYRVPVRPKTYT